MFSAELKKPINRISIFLVMKELEFVHACLDGGFTQSIKYMYYSLYSMAILLYFVKIRHG